MRAPSRILITGATGGIGSALALAYAQPGRTLWLQGRRREVLAQLAKECADRGARVHSEVLDVRDTQALIGWVDGFAREVDLAIVNAGVSSNMRTGERWEDVDHILQVNVRGAMAVVCAVLPSMRERGSGQIALVTSIAAWHGVPVIPAYSASKAALKAYGEALRGWLAGSGVEVNVVLPGFVHSAMSDRFPARRRFMVSPEEAARRIQRGLADNRAYIAFPFLPSLFMRTLAILPPAVSQSLLRALGYSS
jgi:short-subunit dehydrogenase